MPISIDGSVHLHLTLVDLVLMILMHVNTIDNHYCHQILIYLDLDNKQQAEGQLPHLCCLQFDSIHCCFRLLLLQISNLHFYLHSTSLFIKLPLELGLDLPQCHPDSYCFSSCCYQWMMAIEYMRHFQFLIGIIINDHYLIQRLYVMMMISFIIWSFSSLTHGNLQMSA
jgi:hypothetical protein